MAQKEETVSAAAPPTQEVSRRIGISKRVSDHLANERTFLAWVRTGLSIMAFGFVVERFGLLLRELGVKVGVLPSTPVHYSSILGITLTILGILLLVVALLNFLRVRRSIDEEHFHPSIRYVITLTIITSLIGVLLAIYLYLSV